MAIGRNEEELSEVAPWRDLTVVAFNIAKSSIVVFELRKAQTLISFEFNFMQTECVNSLVSFGGNSVAVISLTASESTVQYFNSELRPVRKGLFSPLHVFDKLDEKTGVAAYCQSAKEGTIAIELVHS
ncbi:MAG: hypothetical protein JST59_02855 [Actinobacteria bacterium]|nr:hypothetical protein [Actinomycetota bacterium]